MKSTCSYPGSGRRCDHSQHKLKMHYAMQIETLYIHLANKAEKSRSISAKSENPLIKGNKGCLFHFNNNYNYRYFKHQVDCNR